MLLLAELEEAAEVGELERAGARPKVSLEQRQCVDDAGAAWRLLAAALVGGKQARDVERDDVVTAPDAAVELSAQRCRNLGKRRRTRHHRRRNAVARHAARRNRRATVARLHKRRIAAELEEARRVDAQHTNLDDLGRRNRRLEIEESQLTCHCCCT